MTNHYETCNRPLVCTQQNWNSNGTPAQAYTCSRLITWQNYSIRGPNIPAWAERIKLGLNACTSLNAYRRRLYVNTGGYIEACPFGHLRGGITMQGQILLSANSNAIESSYGTTFNGTLKNIAVNQAKQNFVKSYRKAVTQWQSGQFLGELAETVKFLVSPLKSLERLTLDLGKNLKNLRRKAYYAKKYEDRYLRTATDLWLSWVFGAKPLMNDARDAYHVCREKASEIRRYRIPLIGSGEGSTSSMSERLMTTCSTGGLAPYFTRSDETVVKARIKGIFIPGLGDGTIPKWKELGLAPEDWVPTVYEIIPASFILDYFVNAGAVIDCFSVQELAAIGWRNLFVKQTMTRKCTSPYYKSSQIPGTWLTPDVRAYGGSVKDSAILYERTPNQTDIVPSLTWKLPGLWQSLNLAALANGLDSLKPTHGRLGFG